MLLMGRPSLPPISELAQPELRIAGLRINPRTNGQSRAAYYTSLKLESIFSRTEREITGLPSNPRIADVAWSADAARFAFSLVQDTGIELWVAEAATGRARRVTSVLLNDIYESRLSSASRPYAWLGDSRTLVARTVPEGRGDPPKESLVPTGPDIQENLGSKTPSRTNPDMLKNAADEAQFDYYGASQIALITLDGKVVPLGKPGMYRRVEPSPDGKYLLVEAIHRPYSYQVAYSSFPHRVEIWDASGAVVRQLAEVPLHERTSGVTPGRRTFGWRADTAATVYWVEAGDNGDEDRQAKIRDKVYTLAAPFQGEPAPLIALGLRYAGIHWSSDALALVTERWRNTHRERVWVVKPGEPTSPHEKLFDRSSEDHYNDPGTPISERNAQGRITLLTANGGKSIFLIGAGASPEGNRPFLDEFDLTSKQAKRLWRSEAPYYESVVSLLDDHGALLLTSRESQEDPPNYFLRDLEHNKLDQLTRFPHPAPQLATVRQELIRYERTDGVKLNARLYLPPGYSPSQGPLPMFMWAYPREFGSAEAASQITDSPYRFLTISPSSPMLLLTQGYAILENPTMPIVGVGGAKPNDTYLEQLVASAQAAVDAVVRRGVVDRNRIAIGGHSYGAFMTANLLAHSDLFRAGIARSGAYNRTLTPFGFQNEERTFWQATDTYMKMSPFMYANKIKQPLLMIHGEADNNQGTFTMQSERMYQALKGHGATVRLVLLPDEAHGYQARESVLHVLWEMTEWLNKYVKDAPPRK